MLKMIIAALALMGTTIVIGAILDDGAMQKCQLIYSYDTCFYSLNR